MTIRMKLLRRLYVNLAIKSYNAHSDIYSDVVLRTSHILAKGKDRSNVLQKIFFQNIVTSLHNLYAELTANIEAMGNSVHDSIFVHIYILQEYLRFRKKYSTLIKEAEKFDKECCRYKTK